MVRKADSPQPLARREPRQQRALYKVGLMLEAAMQLLQEGGVAALTTNAVAEKAGVSIGTLYQYFHDKHALLDALVERELGEMGTRITESLRTGPTPMPGERVRHVFRAVTGAYGGRRRVHRQLMEYSLSRSTGTRLGPLQSGISALLSSEGLRVGGQPPRKFTPAQAFVLTHALSGVMRAVASGAAKGMADSDIEESLVQMALSYTRTLA